MIRFDARYRVGGVDYDMHTTVGPRGPKGDPFTYDDFTPEQLALLVGPQGAPGTPGAPGPKGDPFTYADFTEAQLALLIGPKGDPGIPGEPGPKGNPFLYTDFTEAQLEALRGPQGVPGSDGLPGLPGPKGDPFVYTDFTAAQLEALRGPAGADGANGRDGIDGRPGRDGADGQPGAPGAPGYTPQRGVDYWTEADQALILQDVLDVLPAGGGGGGEGGTTNHALLTNRDAAGQHPISAITGLRSELDSKQDAITQSNKLSYSLLTDKPSIPAPVTDADIAAFGYTKNTGTYSKPSGGIPKTDLASAVQTSLGKADTALQNHQNLDHKQDKITQSNKLSYSLLSDTPTIPDPVTDAVIAGFGYTKNTGTYSKPSGGIPKSDLESAVQTSLSKADTALQQHQTLDHKQNTITATGILKGTGAGVAAATPNVDYAEPYSPAAVITASTTLDASHWGQYLPINSANAVTITLPTAADKTEVSLHNIGAGDVSVSGTLRVGGTTGAAVITLATDDAVTLKYISALSAWTVIGSFTVS